MKHKKIFIGSFLLSLFLHMMMLVFFERYSVWFSSSHAVETNSDWLSFVDKKEKDQILKTAFLSIEEESSEVTSLKPKEEAPTLNFRYPNFAEPKEVSSFLQSSFSFAIEAPLIKNSHLPQFTIPSYSSINLLEHLPKDLIVPLPKKMEQNRLFPFPIESKVALQAKTPTVSKEAANTPIAYQDFLDRSLTESPHIGKAPQMIPLPDLPKLPTLADLDTASYSDSFDADLVFLPKDDGEGYIFALTLIPRPDLKLPRLHQEITFLIDRSNSIQQKRLNSTKSALLRSLDYLHEEDRFNIIAFDNKIEKMSPNFLPTKGHSLIVAEKFLDRIQLGSFFSISDLYEPLFLTVPGSVSNDEIHTVILLTDGESLSKPAGARALLNHWTQFNQGKVTLYALGMNDPYSSILETVTAFNKGKLFNSSSFRGLKRKLPKLLKTIQNPIAKNLVCSAIGKSPKSKITIFPDQSLMPHLYLDQPYVILGETDSLDDFILFVQGRLKGRWLNIRKTISFLSAHKGDKMLKKEIALQKAYHSYEKYTQDQNPLHIAEAKKLLKPFGLEVVFQ